MEKTENCQWLGADIADYHILWLNIMNLNSHPICRVYKTLAIIDIMCFCIEYMANLNSIYVLWYLEQSTLCHKTNWTFKQLSFILFGVQTIEYSYSLENLRDSKFIEIQGMRLSRHRRVWLALFWFLCRYQGIGKETVSLLGPLRLTKINRF